MGLSGERDQTVLSPNLRNESLHIVAILVVFDSEMIPHEGFFESGLVNPSQNDHRGGNERAQMTKIKDAAC